MPKVGDKVKLTSIFDWDKSCGITLDDTGKVTEVLQDGKVLFVKIDGKFVISILSKDVEVI